MMVEYLKILIDVFKIRPVCTKIIIEIFEFKLIENSTFKISSLYKNYLQSNCLNNNDNNNNNK